jgi:hypothetical protein
MAAKALPAQDVLLQLLSYNPETGKLFWKARGPEWFSDGRLSAQKTADWWNKRFAYKEAFTAREASGYASGGIFGVIHKGHRVIWVMTHGKIKGEIDHINGDRSDNRLCNLRDVSRVVNCHNRALNTNNASKISGVFFHSATQKWVAKIGIGMSSVHLGVFDSFNEAVAARKAAEREYGFHPNHGRAA